MMQDPVTPTPYYSVPELLTLLAAIGTLLTALIGHVVNGMIAYRTRTMMKQDLKENTEISTATFTKAAIIEGHVNSERSALNEQLNSKQRETEILQRELDERKQAALLLAQANAVAVRQRQSDPNAPHNRRAEDKAADATLAQIETNTRETSEGIQELKDQPSS